MSLKNVAGAETEVLVLEKKSRKLFEISDCFVKTFFINVVLE
jgi:hypothetical protein